MSGIVVMYQKEVSQKLKDEFSIKNPMAIPIVEKIVLNASVVDAISNKEVLEKVKEQLEVISGQKPKITRAKQAISNFKLKKGDPVGVMVTLRGRKAWYFLEKLISVVTPKIRDFRGVSQDKFDKFGNYNLGISEQIIFPEIDYAKIDKVRGLVVTIVIKNGNPQKSKRLLELLGLPFKKGEV
ncbi:50S ribosomal protein L5 [Candidatus Curtissbacteria bacterium]|nr:50S ribosomal protein L5 [Candidatus Curtissbacteria bacterium]